jgi:hypothetical protein
MESDYTMRRQVIVLACAFTLVLGACRATVLASQTAAIEGTYDAVVVAEGAGTTELTLVIKREGDKLVANSSGSENMTISGIVVDGEKVTLKAAWQGNAFDLPGAITGTEMGGKWDNGFVRGTWSAKKRPAK